MSQFQGTVGRKIEIVGVGLHSGKLVKIEIFPAQPNFGIKFLRSDLDECEPIAASPINIVSTTLCTSIGNDHYSISTIEHLMAAFVGVGIDNAIVKVNAPEIPILDGSAAPFVDRLLDAGIQRQPEKRHNIKLNKVVEVSLSDQFMRFEPWPNESKNASRLVIDCTIDFSNSKAIGYQSLEFEFNFESFMKLCEARTFCHIDDVNYMRANGLALGGSLDNAVVVNSTSIINNDGLRYEDEFVRHKILDCIGDLALLGGSLSGKLTTYKAGHNLHAKFTRKVVEILSGKQIEYNLTPCFVAHS